MSNKIFNTEIKYANKKIKTSTAEVLKNHLKELMIEEKLYRNPSLKLFEVAVKLNITTHQFSQLLNDNIGKSFSTFVNEYRIEESKKILKSNTKYSLDAIGLESGFNSKTTFYKEFKKIVGTTPLKYKERFKST